MRIDWSPRLARFSVPRPILQSQQQAIVGNPGKRGIDLEDLHAALTDGSAEAAVEQVELIGRQFGVQGTPAWLHISPIDRIPPPCSRVRTPRRKMPSGKGDDCASIKLC